MSSTTEKITAYRVEVLYSTKREKVLCGMTERAADEGRAYMQAVARHIKPYKARKLIWVKVEPEDRAPEDMISVAAVS